MTQPTQAQIEAAEILSDAVTKLKLLYMAAGLGEKKGLDALRELSAIIDQLSKCHAALTAAAEAGEPLSKEPGGNTFRIQEKLRVQKISDQRLQDATIERCAQVAEQELQNHPIDGATVERIMKIIAAIRALKEKI